MDTIIASYHPFLQDRVIFLDPGHGGEDRVNRGPAEDAIEADVNLRVGLALRDFLTRAGARVIMSRERDTSIALQDRPVLAQRAGAELFVSLHHNAPGGNDEVTNYTSTYYHSRPDHPSYHPANHDLARYVQRDMSYAMRNPNPPFSPTFDGTLSDFDIYPGAGFAVLRGNPLPAVLVEGSFFTHPPEEQRLAEPEFNRIEAWGIFLGIGKYLRAGIPSLALRSDTLVRVAYPPILVEVQPQAEIVPGSIRMMIDGDEVPYVIGDSAGTIVLQPDRPLVSGAHTVSGWARNRAGNHSWPFRNAITVMLPPASLDVVIHPMELPPVAGASARVLCRARDSYGVPVADGSRISIRVPGTAIDTVVLTRDGAALMYVPAASSAGRTSIEVRADPLVAMKGVEVTARESRFLSGVVKAEDDSLPLQGADASLLITPQTDSLLFLDSTWTDGRFVASGPLPAFGTLLIRHAGFYAYRSLLQLSTAVTSQDVALRPIAARRLFGRTYLIDARYGGAETGDAVGMLRSADINLAVARRLHALLSAAGANAVLVRADDSTLPEAERAQRSQAFGRGRYLRIDASAPTPQAGITIYPGIPARQFASALLEGLAQSAGLDSTEVLNTRDEFYRVVALATTTVTLPSVRTGYYNEYMEARVDGLAWGLFAGILKGDRYDVQPSDRFIVRDQNGFPVTGVPVSVGHVLTQRTNASGIVNLFGLSREGEVTVSGLAGAVLQRIEQP